MVSHLKLLRVKINSIKRATELMKTPIPWSQIEKTTSNGDVDYSLGEVE
jgi:hypothetical protein